MKYHIELDPALVQLASVFDKAELTLYLSGESLRAKILGQPCSELEVSSGASPNKVTDLLRSNKSTRVLIDAQSPDTVYIMLKKSPRETLTLRHITLRKEIPDLAGSLRFSISITEDSLHRDFTINALYYVISSRQLLNPSTGFGDIAERIIRPVIQPKLFFGEEPEMILRAIRYSCGLNFSIEPSSMEAIKENIPSLAESTPEAVKRELNALLLLDKEFGGQDVLLPKQQNALGFFTVPPCPAGLLIVGFQTLGHIVVNDKGHVGFIDTHAESIGGHHNGLPVVEEIFLILLPFLVGEPRVIPGRREMLALQKFADCLHIFPGGAIDDAAPMLPQRQQGQKLHPFVFRAADFKAKIGPVKTRDNLQG